MSEPPHSALYLGHVTHARFRPRRHTLDYRIFSLLLDLDELDAIDRRLRSFSVGRFNLLSFHPRDRGDGSRASLRSQVERHMRRAGLEPDGGAIRLLTMPRVLGWSFNPLSVYFCYRRSGEIVAILWEVDNTFGERHGYLIPVADASGSEICQTCSKSFYVSPFMDMDLDYAFRVRPPAETMSIVIDVSDADGLLLTARHLGRRVELSDRALLAAFARLPLQPLRVLGGIHWEALKIWLKGIGLRSRPAPPDELVSVEPEPNPSQKVMTS
ncbi:MAG: DUF1365 domain-containing protein [Hyphomicrobiaceae bacterium]